MQILLRHINKGTLSPDGFCKLLEDTKDKKILPSLFTCLKESAFN